MRQICNEKEIVMRFCSKATITAAFNVALLAVYVTPTFAQGPGPGFNWPFNVAPAYVGRGVSKTPDDCPPMQFHVIPMGKNQLHGIAFEEKPLGATDMQVFEISGTISDEGRVPMSLKPLGGGSPIKVDSVFSGGMLMGSMNGSGKCLSGSFMLMPVAQPALPYPGGK
jgi:hypothetical protein